MIYTEEGYNLAMEWLLNHEKHSKAIESNVNLKSLVFYQNRKKEIQAQFKMVNFPVDQVEKFMKSVVRTYEGW